MRGFKKYLHICAESIVNYKRVANFQQNMISEILILLCLFLFSLKYIWTQCNSQNSKLPPGPWKLPILGHLPLLGFYPHETMLKWSRKFGPIISVQFGRFPAIVLNDTASIKAAFNSPSFTGRPKIKYFDVLFMNRAGLAWTDGPAAQERRDFTKRKLKDFGYGGPRMDAEIQEQVPKLLQIFESHLGSRLEIKHTFGPTTLGYLWGIVNGSREADNDEEYQKFSENIAEIVTAPPVLALSIFLPKLSTWFPNFTGYTKRLRVIKATHQYVQKKIKWHEETWIDNQPRDLTDHFLEQKKLRPDIFTKNAIDASLFELVMGGVDASTFTLEWLIYYLVKYPEMQEKLAREIHAQIPTNQEVRFSDRNKIPYFEAILNETLRISSIAPLAAFHRAIEDTELQGFPIKKDMMVVANTYGTHHDPSIWENPAEFKPERFLGDDGKLNDSVSKLLAFGFRKRKCIGEALGRNQLFLFSVNVFRRYKLRPSGKLPPARAPLLGLTQACENFYVEVTRRG